MSIPSRECSSIAWWWARIEPATRTFFRRTFPSASTGRRACVGDDPRAVDRMRLGLEEPLPEPFAARCRLGDGEVEEGLGDPLHVRPEAAAEEAPGGQDVALRPVFGRKRRVVDGDPFAAAVFHVGAGDRIPHAERSPPSRSGPPGNGGISGVPGIDGGSIGISKTRAPMIVSRVFSTAAGSRRPRTAGRPIRFSPAIWRRIASPRPLPEGLPHPSAGRGRARSAPPGRSGEGRGSPRGI